MIPFNCIFFYFNYIAIILIIQPLIILSEGHDIVDQIIKIKSIFIESYYVPGTHLKFTPTLQDTY